MSNGCPVCAGLGRVIAFGVSIDPVVVTCPECAGMALTPASADEIPRRYSVAEITAMLLGRAVRIELPAPDAAMASG